MTDDRIFFFYGSLMSHDVLGRVLVGVDCRDWKKEEARLDGFRRFRVHGAVYPGIVHSPDNCVIGQAVYIPEDHFQEAAKKLDVFEGVHEALYERRLVQISIGVRLREAHTYVFTGPPHLITHVEWSFDAFLQGKSAFISNENLQ
eukprot:Partr_v1_DN28554_c1_g1_i1_m72973